MSKYTIPCSEEQIKKSLKLGAEEEYLTAEEMIGWLDTHCIFINVFWDDCIYELEIKDMEDNNIPISKTYFNSRKEAILAAIDAALEHLVYLDFCKWKKENNKE